MQRNHTLLGEAWRYGFLFYVSPLNSTGFTPYNKALACFHWDSPLLAAIPGGHAMAPGTRMPFADLFEMVPVGGDLYRLGEVSAHRGPAAPARSWLPCMASLWRAGHPASCCNRCAGGAGPRLGSCRLAALNVAAHAQRFALAGASFVKTAALPCASLMMQGHDPRTSGHILANVTVQTLYEIDG